MERHPKVFCSHRGVDKPKVKEIAIKLAAAGIDPWVDQWEILPGDDLVAKINEGLAGYDVGLLFLSKSSLESGWVAGEVSTLIYQMIEDGKPVIPVMIEADAPIPPLLHPRARLGSEQTQELIDAIYGRRGKPEIGKARTRARERTFRITLRSPDPGRLEILAELDGQPVAPETPSALGADFSFSYKDFLSSTVPFARRSPAEAAVETRTSELIRLGDAVGRAVFPEPVAGKLIALLDEAQSRNESVLLVFETADPNLLAIPFEAARLPGERLPALEPGVRILRRHAGAQPRAVEPLPGPLRILVAIGAPDEGKTKNTVLDIEAELQTILDAVETARRYGNAEVEILEVGHPDQIRDALMERSFHVLHLSGHGGAGTLELETEDGDPFPVTPKDLAEVIRAAQRPLPLVVLASCHGGVTASETASFAQGLLERGIPMVLAMQSSVSDWYATRLAGEFYGRLAKLEEPLPSHALALARQEVERKRRNLQGIVPEYATPSLFCAGAEVQLLDRSAPQLETPKKPLLSATGPVPLLKEGDLIGRRKELRECLKVLREGRKAGVVLRGLGGVGKSALAGRTMSRLADDGWHLAAIEGRWTLSELATGVGAPLLSVGDATVREIASHLLKPDLPDEARLQLLSHLLASCPVLLVLDNFEDNLTLAGTAFLAASTAPVLDLLYRSAREGKLLVTSRYPIPDSEPWLEPLDLGPLSPSQTRKLFYRLAELKDQPPEVLGRVLRLIGGHPRTLEYLDAILRGGPGRLSIVDEKLRENVKALGVRVEDLGGDLDQALQDAVRIGTQGILLQELLEILSPEDRSVLEQASVFPMPIDIPGLAFALKGSPDPSQEQIEKVRQAVETLVRTSLLTPLDEDSVWVHRWTAEALKDKMTPADYQECCRKAGEFLFWKVGSLSHALTDGIEGLRLFLQAEAFDEATAELRSIISFMFKSGQSSAIASLAGEVLARLPQAHREYPAILGAEADALRATGDTGTALHKARESTALLEERLNNKKLNKDPIDLRNLSVSYNKLGDLYRDLGQSEDARDFYQRALAIAERLAYDQSDRTDLKTEISILYDRLGDLQRTLGQDRSASELLRKSLLIREQLARNEPGHEDHQRNLAFSYNKLGDLYKDLGQSQTAIDLFRKALSIREQLARDEPNRIDSQRDLAVSYSTLGESYVVLGEGVTARELLYKSLLIFEHLTRSEPNCADYQRDLAICYSKIGEFHSAISQRENARECFQRALTILERLTHDEPNRTDNQRALAVYYNKTGEVLSDLGQREEALKCFQSALLIVEHLASNEPDRTDYQRDLAISYGQLGDLNRAIGQIEIAREFLHRTLSITERLAREEPNRTDYQRYLAISYSKLGEIHGDLGQDGVARELYQKDLEVTERLARGEPNRADYQADLVTSLVRVAWYDSENGETHFRRALSILNSMKERGALFPTQERWIELIEQQLLPSAEKTDDSEG